MDLCLIFQLKSYLCSTNRKGMNVIYDLSEMLTSFTMTELVKASNCFPCKGIIPDSSRGNTKCLCGVSVDTKHGLLVFRGFCVTRRPCRRNVLPSEWLESLVFENLQLPRGVEARFLAETASCVAWNLSLSEISLSVPHGRSVFARNGCSALHGKRFFRAAWLSCRSEGGIFRRLGFRATRKAEISVGRSFMSHRKQIFPSAELPCHSEAVLLAEDSLRAAGWVF